MSTEPFDHTHNEQTWDEYATKDGKHIVAVEYNNGRPARLHIRFGTGADSTPGDKLDFGGSVVFEKLSEVNQLLTALHAAVAGIHKKGIKTNATE